jgi:hypothetical protein
MDQRAADQRPAEQRLPEQRAAEQRPPEQRALDQRAAEQRPWDPPLQDQRPAEQRAAPRVADTRNDIRPAVAPPPRPIMLAARRPPLQASAPLPASGPVAAAPIFTPSRPPPVAAPSPYGGSLLGMARGSMPASPRPTPVSAQYNAN